MWDIEQFSISNKKKLSVNTNTADGQSSSLPWDMTFIYSIINKEKTLKKGMLVLCD